MDIKVKPYICKIRQKVKTRIKQLHTSNLQFYLLSSYYFTHIWKVKDWVKCKNDVKRYSKDVKTLTVY